MAHEPVPVSAPDATASSAADETASPDPPRAFSQRVIDIGFLTGLLLALICLLIAGWYLISYQHFASQALEATMAERPPSGPALAVHIYLARALLQSCGLATGMAFGFLGFSLFLLGVSGNMDASATGGGGLGVQVARISPGAFVMLCAAILVGICATSAIPAEMGGGHDRSEHGLDDANAFGTSADGNPANESVDMSIVEQNEANEAAAEGNVS